MSACAGAGASAGEPPAAEAEADKPAWSFGGYGSAGVVHSSEERADFTGSTLNPGSAGHGHRWASNVDSRLGVQLGLTLSPSWSAVLQLVSESTRLHAYRPAVEWANLQYRVSSDLSVRLGRIALPLFLAGDYRKASYALPWVRPPVDLYSAIPISNSDGIDASYRWRVAELNQVTQVMVGHTSAQLTRDTQAQSRRLLGLSNTTTSGALTVRVSAQHTRLSADVGMPMFNALRRFNAQGEALAERYQIKDTPTRVLALGLNYDPGQWFLMGEIGRASSASFFSDKTGAYLSGGYRYGNLSPYLTVSGVRANSATHSDGLALDGLAPERRAAAVALNNGLNALLGATAQQRTLSAGLRWDWRADYALKLQYDRIKPLHGSPGTLINVQPGFRSDHAIGVFSVLLDFVF
ncbi:hypothetical protein HSX11_20500 [Oxalobacteraceae bacterium]|nr:hypothetical protein [Oxalobacteraceae bacterium]